MIVRLMPEYKHCEVYNENLRDKVAILSKDNVTWYIGKYYYAWQLSMYSNTTIFIDGLPHAGPDWLSTIILYSHKVSLQYVPPDRISLMYSHFYFATEPYVHLLMLSQFGWRL